MWHFVPTLCISVAFIMTLAFCLCWRKKTPKSDWLGLDGMVTQKNPDENVNHLPSAATTVIAAAPPPPKPHLCVVDGPECEPRNVPVHPHRSLPDIPAEQGDGVQWEPQDNSSEHYATLGQYQNAKRHTLPNGIDSRPSMSQHSSMSQADSPYEHVKYDKIKSKEHPYAQLQPTTSRQVAVVEENHVDERTFMLRPEASSSEPTAPPRSRRSSNHSSVNSDIPAASAVAGGVAASPDLPYMTPPVQVNFSGDSQDSSKGYTSISVREPLANIIAQTKEMKPRENPDQHYSTVSDDSDDVYTTIPDPNNQIYTSESETYARIPAHPVVVEAEVNEPPPDEDVYEAPPPPQPSHSRQASTSSSVANVGSPKPEKRQANSPLPPPPPSPRNLDDLYAKVHKTKRKEEHTATVPDEAIVEIVACDVENPSTSAPSVRVDHNYETLKKQLSSPEKCQEEPGYASINGPDSLISSDPGYEVLKRGLDPNYEELKTLNSFSQDFSSDEPNYESMPSESDPNYESVSQLDPNYESVKDGYEKIRNRGYENIDSSESSNGTEKQSRSEPPYEQLSNNDTDSEVAGGYEKIQANAAPPPPEPNYATIERTKSDREDEEIFQV